MPSINSSRKLPPNLEILRIRHTAVKNKTQNPLSIKTSATSLLPKRYPKKTVLGEVQSYFGLYKPPSQPTWKSGTTVYNLQTSN